MRSLKFLSCGYNFKCSITAFTLMDLHKHWNLGLGWRPLTLYYSLTNLQDSLEMTGYK